MPKTTLSHMIGICNKIVIFKIFFEIWGIILVISIQKQNGVLSGCFRSRFGKVARDVIVDIPSFAKRKWYTAIPSHVKTVSVEHV